MKLLATLLALGGPASAHYIFQQLSIGGTQYPPWTYIRRNSNPDWLQNGPVTDLSSNDLRCNVGGGVSNGTETVTVKAGSEFTFTLDTAVYHVGPTSMYVVLETRGGGPLVETNEKKIHVQGSRGCCGLRWQRALVQDPRLG